MEIVEILAAGSLYELAFSILCQAPSPTSSAGLPLSILQKSQAPPSENYLVKLVDKGLVKFAPALCESISEMLGDVEPFYEVSREHCGAVLIGRCELVRPYTSTLWKAS